MAAADVGGAAGARAKPSAQDGGGSGGGSTGAGAEAARGIQSATQDGGTSPDGAKQQDASRSGSEPLPDRSTEHEGSYGGKGGAPRTSSDQREGKK